MMKRNGILLIQHVFQTITALIIFPVGRLFIASCFSVFLVAAAHAQDIDSGSSTSTSEQTTTITTTTTTTTPAAGAKPKDRRTTLDFEDELVEGSSQKPDMIYLFQQKNFNYKKLIKHRDNFLPEMRKTTEDVQRVRSGG